MDISTNWKKYLETNLNPRVIHYLDEYFVKNNIHAQTLKDIQEIDWRTLELSWLSVPSCKELLLFQQMIR